MASRSRLSSSSSAISCLERCATWLVCACAAMASRNRSIRSTSSRRAISAARLDSSVSVSRAYTSSSLMATSASSSMSSVSLSKVHTRSTSAPSFHVESVRSERVLVSRSSSVHDARLRSSLVLTSSASAFAASMRDRWCACVASYRSRATSALWTNPAMPPLCLASSGSTLNMASISFARPLILDDAAVLASADVAERTADATAFARDSTASAPLLRKLVRLSSPNPPASSAPRTASGPAV